MLTLTYTPHIDNSHYFSLKKKCYCDPPKWIHKTLMGHTIKFEKHWLRGTDNHKKVLAFLKLVWENHSEDGKNNKMDPSRAGTVSYWHIIT